MTPTTNSSNSDTLTQLKCIRSAVDSLIRSVEEQGINIIVEAPVFALDDFEERVKQALKESQSQGNIDDGVPRKIAHRPRSQLELQSYLNSIGLTVQ